MSLDSEGGGTFEVRERVRWSDCDPLGIIYFGSYIRFFEIAEFELFRACGLPFERLRRELGVALPRKAFDAVFHSPAEMDEEVIVQASIVKIGTTSLTFRFEVLRASDRTPRASATLTVVNVDRATMQKRAILAEVRSALAPFVRP